MAIMDAAAKSLPLDRLMVGTGAAAVGDAVALTRHAAKLGFAAALVLPPFYYKGVGDSGIVRYIERLAANPDAYSPEVRAKVEWRIKVTGQSLEKAVPRGVKIAFGTDAGVSRHGRNADEFELMVKHGMTPSQAIVAATRNAAELLGVGDEVGSLEPGRHADLIAGLVSIPEVMPGDTVFWHTDICHAVADKHEGNEYASVIYIGSAPDCPKNRAYLPRQRDAFLAGRSAPDFAAMDFEVDFKGRATLADLTDLGRAQMGF